MNIRLSGTKLNISFYFAATVTIILILDKSGTAAIAIAACVLHECGHLVCLLGLGEVPACISLEIFGMRIDRGNTVRLSIKQEIAAAFSGPFANLLVAFLSVLIGIVMHSKGIMQSPVYLNLFIAAFNLLPIEPLDGSKILYYLLCLWRDEALAARITRTVSAIALFPVAMAGFYILLKSGYNFTLLIAAGYLILLFIIKSND